MRNIVIMIVLIAVNDSFHPSLYGQQRRTQQGMYYCRLASYHQALDEGFSRVAGATTGSAISVRVLASFQPERELIVDKIDGQPSIMELRLESSVWSHMTTFRTQPTRTQCLDVARNIAVNKLLVPIAAKRIDELVQAFEQVDMSTDNCLRDASGRCVGLNDGTTYEVRAGKARGRVTDVRGPHLTSENPALLQWIHKLIDGVENAEARP